MMPLYIEVMTRAVKQSQAKGWPIRDEFHFKIPPRNTGNFVTEALLKKAYIMCQKTYEEKDSLCTL